MDITTLPEDLNTASSDNIEVFNYRTSQDILKTKIVLSKHTISFLRTGTKEVIGSGKATQINDQSFLMMKSGHCLMTEKTSNSDHIYHSILLFFDAEVALSFLEKHGLSTASDSIEKPFFVFQYDEFIQQFVKSLESLIKLPKATQKQLLNAKFEELMVYLTAKFGPSFLSSILRNLDNRASRLNAIIENNKFNRLSLDELAFLCNMSVSTFKRAFYKMYAETPMKWFSEQRLSHTAHLLKTHQHRPIDVYETAGYESFSNFVQAFKKKYGVTPKQFQREN